MTTTYYSHGYGVREEPPECDPTVVDWRDNTISCPCCEGAGEHPYGKGMDQDAIECDVCRGCGRFEVSLLPRKR